MNPYGANCIQPRSSPLTMGKLVSYSHTQDTPHSKLKFPGALTRRSMDAAESEIQRKPRLKSISVTMESRSSDYGGRRKNVGFWMSYASSVRGREEKANLERNLGWSGALFGFLCLAGSVMV